MRRFATIVHAGGLGSALVLLQGCATVPPMASHSRDLPMFYQVDEGLYRGGQPSDDGLRQLQRKGIKTVISLRQPSKAREQERRLVEQLGMRWVSIPMWFWWRPSDRQVQQFLEVAADPAQRPVFVHCQQGWNRSGILVAIYRMVAQGWPARRAYAEARQLGLVPWNLASRYLLFYEVPREWPAASSAPDRTRSDLTEASAILPPQ